MKSKTFKKAFAALFFLSCLSVSAQTIRKYSNEFMNIGVDAAALGMANAATAITSDVNATYWNPAGLLHLEEKQLSLMHASWFANIATYNFAAFAMPIDEKSTVGISAIRFGVDDILNTTQLIDQQGNIDYSRISKFSTADYGFTVSYARSLPFDGLSYGANAKVIHRIIGKFATSWGFGFDLGLQYRRNDWMLGAMVRDITTTYNLWSIDEEEFATIQGAVEGENQEMPETTEVTLPKFHLGAARRFRFGANFDLLTSLNLNMRAVQTNDIVSTEGFSLDPAFGFQLGYTDLVFLRGGVGNFQNITQLDGSDKVGFQPNAGIGFHYKGIAVDYALTDIGDQSAALYSHIFSLRLDFGVFK